MDMLIQDSENEFTLNPSLELNDGVWITVGNYSLRLSHSRVALFLLGEEDCDAIEWFDIPSDSNPDNSTQV